jgi:hypothetical protein
MKKLGYLFHCKEAIKRKVKKFSLAITLAT